MSKACQICGKSYQKGNLVRRGIGNRVSRRTINKKMANIRIKRFLINGVRVKFKLCSSCLKRIMKDQRELLAKSSSEKETETK